MLSWNPTRAEQRVRQSLMCIGMAFACGAADPIAGLAVPDPTARAAQVQTIATWNAIALKTTAEGPFSPPRESRAMALVSAAVFDAVASITRQYEPYAVRVDVNAQASIQAAVSSAAHDILVALYPTAVQALAASYDSALALVPAGRSKEDGVKAGRSVAAALLAKRASDRATDPAPYTPGTGLGVWRPTLPPLAPALEPGWGKVKPFMLDSGSQFRPAPPPQPGSPEYVRDYVEIANIGKANSSARTPLQTEVGRFWIATASQLWNQVVRQVTIARAPDAATAARAFLLLNLAGADAMIAAWEAKFTYNQWRPLTAIRFLGDDGDLTTQPDTLWMPLIVTPPFPDYPAGHTAYGGAAEQVLSATLGENPGELTITSATAGGATHRYRSFREISEEVVNARVWAGVHWRTSSTAGRDLGRRIGDLALARAPKRAR